MNNYYELKYLSNEIADKIGGASFDVAISPHKNVLEIFLQMRSESLRLIFSADPSETALFLDKYRPPKKNNVIEFFKPLEGQECTGVNIAKNDRLLYFYFDKSIDLLFKLYGGKPNVFMVKDEEVLEAFKNPEEVEGAPPPEPFAPEFADQVSGRAKPKNQITRLNPLLPRNLIPQLVEQHGVDEMKPEQVKEFVGWITEELEEHPVPRVLATGETCLWSEKVLDIPTDTRFNTVNDCIRHAYRNAVHLRRLQQKKESVRQMLERALARQQGQLEQLQQADKSLERADRYEKYGHLLMANAHEEIRPDVQQLEVEDLYGDNDTVEIPLKERMSVAENAQYYYEKAKDSRTSYQNAIERIDGVEKEIERLESLLEELEAIDRLPELDKWLKNSDEALKEYGYGSDDRQQATSPFRKFEVGKYEVWIGKNAKSNDKLTSLAHKEDVWLHARGVGGSHVVIRMGNRKDFPPKKVILQAASYAAYYSKARGMRTAPVMYTKVKYVRKPKGASPGAVVVEREQVEMVPPHKPQ